MMIIPIRTSIRGLRWLLLALIVPLVAACQSIPPQPASPYSAEQVALLKSYDFQQNGDEWVLGLQGKLLFAFDDSNLAEEQAQRLKEMASALRKVGIAGCTVNGHADSIGTEQYNQQLSLRRAEAVRGALVAGGLSAGHVTAVGKGSSQPIESNGTADGRQENRRVVILISADDVAL
ncbi:OmpA family protein [Tsuneonella suprasediminis]|uniref:OmpA family protein n=1 Tax=Tsuneonella suprasediminis TaxID=2306996 RepID=UPI002F925BF8